MSKNNHAAEQSAPDGRTPADKKIISQRLKPNPLSQFSMDKDALRLALVTAQYALRATRQQSPPTHDKATGLLVLVNGMEQAGKGTAVKQLRGWVDPRLLKVEATVGDCPLDYQPIWQTHTNVLPRHGDVMVYFGNWYADLLYDVMRMTCVKDTTETAAGTKSQNKQDDAPSSLMSRMTTKWQDYLQQQLAKLTAFEQDLAANQTRLLKCWFHVDVDTLQKRLTDKTADPQFLYQMDWHDRQVVDTFNEVATALLRQQPDWVIIDGEDKSAAADNFCHEVLHAMQEALASSKTKDDTKDDTKAKSHPSPFVPVAIPNQLQDIPSTKIDKSDYKEALAAKQARLAALLRARNGRHVVFAFEGMDAAGKGGAIKRLVAPLDPREYQIYNIGAPMLHELQHPYLWRFWHKLPNEHTDRISRIAIFDRTWYGRVLVERIEGFADAAAWQRAYDEINRFEADLADAGTLVIKYWLAIDKKEQLQRFEARQQTPHKQYKLTEDDWRNRDKWERYVQAAADMLARTDTDKAPWCIIATNEKRQARLQVLDHAIEQLS